MTAEGVYVYAIVRAGRPLPTGAGGVGSPAAPLRTIRQGRLAAVVSEAPPKLRARRRDLLAHQELLLRLSAEGPVLPMRFGMVAPDEETVRGRLAADEADHVAALERLSDGVEINVKALPAQNALADLVAEDKKVRRLRDEARRRPGYEASLRLGEAVTTALQSRAAEAGRRILRELTPWPVRWPRGRTSRDACSTCRSSSAAATATTSTGWRNDSPTGTAHTSSCASRARCPVTASSPLKPLTLVRPESDMGLLTGLLTFPVAPVRGVIWVAEKLNEAAERELHDPGVLRAQLAVLNQELEDGDISLEEFEREEERLLDRLHAAQVGSARNDRR
ncbi:hypothetical protein SAV14893_015460 [Streptomyces avermitilis]|nr:hypothetical protein SAV14893_015460 [Streptomyces avermitilis]GDY86621.1 hypothetical protein SAVCW2_58200 [Streptomyces avermitilis]